MIDDRPPTVELVAAFTLDQATALERLGAALRTAGLDPGAAGEMVRWGLPDDGTALRRTWSWTAAASLATPLAIARACTDVEGLQSVWIEREARAGGAEPRPPLAGAAHVLAATDAVIAEHFDDPSALDRAFASARLPNGLWWGTRGMDVEDDAAWLAATYDGTMALARAAQPRLTRYPGCTLSAGLDPSWTPDAHGPGETALDVSSYVAELALVEAVARGDRHVSLHAIRDVRRGLQLGIDRQGRPLEAVRVCFDDERIAWRERRPLLDAGARVAYRGAGGAIVEIDDPAAAHPPMPPRKRRSSRGREFAIECETIKDTDGGVVVALDGGTVSIEIPAMYDHGNPRAKEMMYSGWIAAPSADDARRFVAGLAGRCGVPAPALPSRPVEPRPCEVRYRTREGSGDERWCDVYVTDARGWLASFAVLWIGGHHRRRVFLGKLVSVAALVTVLDRTLVHGRPPRRPPWWWPFSR